VPGPDQGGDGSGVVGDLGIQELDAASQGTQAGRGGDGLGVSGGLQPEPPAGADQARRGVRSSNDQRMQLALAIAGSLDRGASGGQPDRQRRTVAGSPWLGELVAAQRLAGCPDRLQGVGLGAVAAGGPLGPVQLDHSFGMGVQEPGQPSTVAAGASIAHTR
jgi:hypothetical protein